MKRIVLASIMLSQFGLITDVLAQEPTPTEEVPAAEEDSPIPITKEVPTRKPPVVKLGVNVGGIEDGQIIPPKFAYCTPDGKGQTKNSENISPSLSWSGAPEGTKSYVLIVVDKDVPASFESANQPGKVIPFKFPRQDFYHWVLVDIPPNVKGLLEGKDSNGITPGGKPFGKVPYGINGQNDYAKVYPGSFGGYDGPCPPWNDQRQHHYHFIVYALDIPSVGLHTPIHGKQVEIVMADHVLGMGEVVGTYNTNPVWLSPSSDGGR